MSLGVKAGVAAAVSYHCLTGGSYISKSDRPYADRPSQHLQLAPSHVASRGSGMSQTLHHRDLPGTRQLKKASVPGMLCLLAPYSYHVPA
jgi:hypothetical protein